MPIGSTQRNCLELSVCLRHRSVFLVALLCCRSFRPMIPQSGIMRLDLPPRANISWVPCSQGRTCSGRLPCHRNSLIISAVAECFPDYRGGRRPVAGYQAEEQIGSDVYVTASWLFSSDHRHVGHADSGQMTIYHGLALAVFGWAWDARVIRSQVLSLRKEFTGLRFSRNGPWNWFLRSTCRTSHPWRSPL